MLNPRPRCGVGSGQRRAHGLHQNLAIVPQQEIPGQIKRMAYLTKRLVPAEDRAGWSVPEVEGSAGRGRRQPELVRLHSERRVAP